MVKRVIGRVTVLFTVLTSVLAGTQVAAMADFSWCPAGKLCFATDVNGNGTKWSYLITSMRGGVEMSSNQRSQVSSVYNRTGGGAWLWDNLTCNSPLKLYFAPGQAANLSTLAYDPYNYDPNDPNKNWDNRARSFGSDQNLPPANNTACAHLNG